VRVVGGSMTFHANNKWNKTGPNGCDNSTGGLDACTYTTKKILNKKERAELTVEIDDVQTVIPVNNKLRVDLYVFDQSASKIGQYPAVSMCYSDAAGDCTVAWSASGMYVTLTLGPKDPNNRFHNKNQDFPVGSAPTDHGKRFRYDGCKVEKGELCQQIGHTSVTIGAGNTVDYPCPDGNCRVWIGPG